MAAQPTNEILWFLVFFLPAYIANMAPPFFRKLPWNAPIDGGATFRGHPVFGKNKTWRGLVVGTLLGGLTGYIMQWSGLPVQGWWGFALGFAALAGDVIESFFKRQIGIAPGGRWMPFDQLDFIVAAWLISLAFVTFAWHTVLICFALIFVGTIIVQIGGNKTGVKADKL